MSTDYTGTAFLKALQDDALAEPLIRIGMAKKHGDSSDDFLFAARGCGSWIEVPIELVDKVTFLQMAPCRDHQHPLVMVAFKAPPKDHRAATLYAELARSAMSTMPAGKGNTVPPGSNVPPQASAARIGGGGLSIGPGHGLADGCIVWHQECHWGSRWIPELRINIPWLICENVCDTIE